MIRSAERCRWVHLVTSIAVLALVVMTPRAASATTDVGVLRHLHTSGRFDVSRRVLEKALDRFMADADLVTTTEIHDKRRASALEEPGWQRFWRPAGPRASVG